jgi:hypothetical protein
MPRGQACQQQPNMSASTYGCSRRAARGGVITALCDTHIHMRTYKLLCLYDLVASHLTPSASVCQQQLPALLHHCCDIHIHIWTH